MDKLLDKVSQVGIHKLSNSERKSLDFFSKELYGKKEPIETRYAPNAKNAPTSVF